MSLESKQGETILKQACTLVVNDTNGAKFEETLKEVCYNLVHQNALLLYEGFEEAEKLKLLLEAERNRSEFYKAGIKQIEGLVRMLPEDSKVAQGVKDAIKMITE